MLLFYEFMLKVFCGIRGFLDHTRQEIPFIILELDYKTFTSFFPISHSILDDFWYRVEVVDSYAYIILLVYPWLF
jgi:hypothetical protein